MSNLPQINDVIDVWVSFDYGVTHASVLRTYKVLFTSGLALPDYETHKTLLASWNLLRFEPILGNGVYAYTQIANIFRDGSPLETTSLSTYPLEVFGHSHRLPPGVSPISTFRPFNPKPRQVSRLYWPHASLSLLGDDTLLSPAGEALITAQANLFLGILDWGGAGYSLRTRNVIRHKATGSLSFLETTKTLPEIGTQKRRNRGNQKKAWT